MTVALATPGEMRKSTEPRQRPDPGSENRTWGTPRSSSETLGKKRQPQDPGSENRTWGTPIHSTLRRIVDVKSPLRFAGQSHSIFIQADPPVGSEVSISGGHAEDEVHAEEEEDYVWRPAG
jgi:hypothetical protein